MAYTHLHVHSEYSLLDGLSHVPDLVARAKELGQTSLAITDHGNMHGAIEFYEEARKHDLNPIIGIEAYMAQGSRLSRGATDRSQFHLTLLAQNEVGYRNLLKLSSAAHLEGFYYKPRMDRELLAAHSEGLIALSACPSGELMSALGDGREADAAAVAGWYKDIFPGRYYIELQEHGQQQFSRLNRPLVDLARSMDLPMVVTNDSHYTLPNQHKYHDILLCIGTNSVVTDPNRMKMDSPSFYLKSEQEMRALFPELGDAFDNTARIAESVDIKIQFGRAILPDAGVPEGVEPVDYLRQLCEEGLYRRYVTPTEEHIERLRYEISVVAECGFVEYMLIVRDLALFARSQKIPMGVRGSAAASIILYCLGVTDIEPLQYRLVFERFLNLERHEMPDVDFDFADARREEVIRYASERYGRDRVAQIVTFGTLGAKAAIRDSGRALGMQYGEVDRVARLIPNALHVTLDKALEEVEELRQMVQDEPPVAELIDTARGLEGVARHASTHAAGIVISREPLTDVVPLQRATSSKDDSAETLPTTQYAMAEVAKIGLVKMDFLGLINLTILGHAVELIRSERGEDLDLTALPDADPDTAELLAKAQTFGVFQMESAGMRRYVAELQPKDIRELSAMVALYRPGPMEHIPRYIEVKHGRAAAHYPHEDLADLLDETYGVITYQDQVLQIAQKFGGYTLGEADIMRKAMGKKIASVMLAEREKFVSGAIEKGYDQKLAEQVFDLIEPFAGYAFNKAHAFSYGTIAYQTAYLKAHYSVEYMTAVLMAAGNAGALDRVAEAIAECTRLGITVLQPDVNKSKYNFSVEHLEDGSRAIRFGLAQIKHVGSGAVETLIAERDAKGTFEHLENFARRLNTRELNRRVLESLAKAGALDSLGNRSSIVFGIDRILSLAQQEQRLRETGQTSMFDLFGTQVDTPLPALELPTIDTPQAELLGWERELLGTYLSDHPFQHAAGNLARYVTAQLTELTAEIAGNEVVVAGMITTVRQLATRQGKPFGAVAVEDLSGTSELTIWPEQFAKYREFLIEGAVLMARVSVRERGDRLTIAVEKLCGYDLESGRLLGAEPSMFIGAARPQVIAAAAAPVMPDPDGGRYDDLDTPAPRPALRAIERETSVPAPASAANNSSAQAGPPRLRITMEETTDQGADRRRLQKIMALVGRTPGDHPVELALRLTDGHTELLRLGGVADMETLLPELQPLLGVLGKAKCIGSAERAYAIAAG
ncbi:MAG: DNA polymerase III subunit alpha [Chloroflexi bacterium]|nr:MAG: DNA polymerase III subunit alpha [Chloroflexota bacterium]